VIVPLRPAYAIGAGAALAVLLVPAGLRAQDAAPHAPAARQAPSAQAPESAPSLVDLVLSVRERMRLETQIQRARTRLAVLGKEADGLAAQQRTLLGELRQLDLQRERHTTEELAARASGTLARAALTETTRKIEEVEARVAERAPAVRARVLRLHKLGSLDAPRHWVRPEGLAQTARAWRLLAAVAKSDREVLLAAAADRMALRQLQSDQQARADEAARLERAAQDARRAAARAMDARERLLTRLDGERDLAARLAGELQNAEERLGAMLNSPTGTPPGTNGHDAVLPLAPFKGDLDWPVEGRVLTRFGPEREARFGTVLPRNGLEITAADAAPVRAVHEGRVVFADEFAGLGRLIIVEHGRDAFTLYGHLGALAVARGDEVARGTRIGSVGRTPSGTEALYFELRIDGRPVDPVEWFKPAPIRRARLD
jgi:septal ring factor EnvC (AmiA/AmiB activator)